MQGYDFINMTSADSSGNAFRKWMAQHRVSLHELFPTLNFSTVIAPDMSSGSAFFAGNPEHEDLIAAASRLQAFQEQHPTALLANGYMEPRSFYNTASYEQEGRNGTEYRSIHLGTDFWVPAGTPVHAPFGGVILISHNNDYHKDYGPTLVIEHRFDDITFYTLYGHLSLSSLSLSEKGRFVKQGERIGTIGISEENGHWVPHLHFQVITDILGNTENYNGVAFPSEIEVWKSRCPDPGLLFKETLPSARQE